MILRHIQCAFFSLYSFILLNMAFNENTFRIRQKREGQGQSLRRLSPANPCLLKCKDDYMMSSELSPRGHRTQNWQLDNAIGSPLHALVETANAGNAMERIGFECSYHANFVSCLGQCGTSPAAKILMEGQETLKTVCQSFKGEREFVGSVLPCLARNGPEIGKSCQLHWSLLEKDIFEALQSETETKQQNEEEKKQLEEGIRQICRALNSYADCHLRTVAQLCHRRALSFFVQLNAKSSAALLRLLVGWAGLDAHSVAQKLAECAPWNLDVFGGNDGHKIVPLVSPTVVALCVSIIFTLI